MRNLTLTLTGLMVLALVTPVLAEKRHHNVNPPPHEWSQSGIRRLSDGTLIDREGWRLKNGEWTSDCFRTLDYMGTDSACRR
jgi:hypothetical protein